MAKNDRFEKQTTPASNPFAGLTEYERELVIAISNKGLSSWRTVADSIGISERHLFRERKKPKIQQAVRNYALDNVNDGIPAILATLTQKAVKGDVRSIELILQMTQLLTNNYNIHTTTDDSNANANELNNELRDVERQLKLLERKAE